jgi:F-type H+-transporting ATPase subunit b
MNLIIAASNGGVTDILRETAETFGWNWKLFLSQVISFCIVAFLLQRFAYKPILAVLEERRRKIEEGQINAEKIKKELAEAEKRYQEIVAKANADAQKMIDEARESAAHLSERLVVDTTAKVAGKVLTPEDQRRLQEEATRQLA